MKTYDEKPINEIKFTNYKIVVPSEEDKKELQDAFEHIHYSDVDTNFVTVNQIAHEYLTSEIAGYYIKGNIIVDKKIYEELNK